MTHGHLLAGSTTIPYHIGHGEDAVAMTRRAGTVAVDIETAGLGNDAWIIRSVQIADENEAYVLDPAADSVAIFDALHSAKGIVVHNSPFDIPILVGSGFMNREAIPKVWDTLIASRMATPSDIGGHDLGTTYTRHLPNREAGDKKALHKRWREVTGKSKAEMFQRLGPDDEAFAQYAANDAVMTARLPGPLVAAMRAHTEDHPFSSSGPADYLLEREQTINRIMLDRTCLGIEVDYDVIDDLTVELTNAAQDADRMLVLYGIDVEQSPVKVKEAVMDRLDQLGAIPDTYPRLVSGRATADSKHRQHLSHPMLDALEARSKALRFVSDYANKLSYLARDGRIHPQVSIAAAITGRMSMKDPPLQQYPAGVRRMMKFDTDAVSMDWSSIEPVLFANLAGETSMIEEFEQGGDLYLPVADAAGVPRKTAKVILLAQFYGQGRRKLAWSLGISEDEAAELVDRVMGRLPNITGAIKAIRSVGNKYGKAQTLSGRICPIAPDWTTGTRTFMGYLAVNYVVQGGAYDLLAEAIYEMHRRGLSDALYVAVHDELVVAAEAANEVEQIMRTPPSALIEQSGRVPTLRVGRTELGRHWMPKEG